MDISKPRKAYIAAAILLSAAFLLSSCGNDRGGASTLDTPEEPNDIYREVLAEYRDMVQNGFYEDLRDTDAYESSFGPHIGYEVRTHKQDLYYALYDIDGNGTKELLIAGGENAVSEPEFTPWNYGLYGYDGTNVVRIFPDMDFGYRINFSLYKDGIIAVTYSSSAAESGTDFYRLSADGSGNELVDSFSAIGHLEGDDSVFTYYRGQDEISEEDYNAGIQIYQTALTTPPEWIPIQ